MRVMCARGRPCRLSGQQGAGMEVQEGRDSPELVQERGLCLGLQ